MITIVGAGDIKNPKGMSLLGYEKIIESKNVVFQSDKQACFSLKDAAFSLDEIYEDCQDFDKFIIKACEFIESFDDVVFVAIGDGIRNNICTCLCKRNKETMVIQGTGSSAVCCALKYGKLENDNLVYINGHDFKFANTNYNCLVYEIDNEFLFYDIKSRLLDFYPIDTQIIVNEKMVKLCDAEPILPCDIFLPKVELLDKPVYFYEDLMNIVLELREKCPWDREQTHKSIRVNLLEESCEMLEAIDKEDSQMLIEEMGDVLLQVCLHNVMEMEHGDVEFFDVTTKICQKLIRRHPHVYGEIGDVDTKQVLNNWDNIKKVEYDFKNINDELEHICKILPGVMRANKVLKKADKQGIELKGDIFEILESIGKNEDLENNSARLMLLIIDMLRKKKINPYMMIHDGTNDFIKKACVVESNEKNISIDVKNVKIDNKS